jgi:hypothetical protein
MKLSIRQHVHIYPFIDIQAQRLNSSSAARRLTPYEAGKNSVRCEIQHVEQYRNICADGTDHLIGLGRLAESENIFLRWVALVTTPC